MKVLCDRGALLDAINLISGVVANRSPRPQLKCVKLTATKDGQAGQLMLEATDAELSMTLLTERVDVEQPGEALIPADKLAQIVRAEENEPTLTLEVDGDTTHIRGADAHFQLRGFEAKDFPEIPGFDADRQGRTPPSPSRPARSSTSSGARSSPPPARTAATRSTACSSAATARSSSSSPPTGAASRSAAGRSRARATR
jgi:hypothetical protein